MKKYVSAIYGFIVGDALGVPVEFKSREYMKLNPVKDMLGYGTHQVPKGTWSDDSSLTLILLENLISGYNPKILANGFCSWYFEGYWSATSKPFDVGIATLDAIRKLKEGVPYNESGCKNENCNGNGSLMRILPLVFYTKDMSLDERLDMIREVSSITHSHIRSIICCLYYVEFLQLMMNSKGTSFLELLSKHQLNMKMIWQTYEFGDEEKMHFDRLLNFDFNAIAECDIQSSGYVIHTLEASIWCCIQTNSYEEAVLKAVNLGGDTDTIGAITGSIAGLYYGYDSIPLKWIESLVLKDKICKLLMDFTNKFQKKESKIIYIDFDGTIQENNYPEIGFLNEGVSEFLSTLKNLGYELILNSYRANMNDNSLDDALNFIKKHNLPIYKYNDEKIHPTDWSQLFMENKFIDDECEGIPLKTSNRILNKVIVDFEKLNILLKNAIN